MLKIRKGVLQYKEEQCLKVNDLKKYRKEFYIFLKKL